jgi:hypothetical protein
MLNWEFDGAFTEVGMVAGALAEDVLVEGALAEILAVALAEVALTDGEFPTFSLWKNVLRLRGSFPLITSSEFVFMDWTQACGTFNEGFEGLVGYEA